MEELLKPENQSKIKGKSYCKKHASKKLKLYCETCEELICTYCVVFEHVRPDHVCSPLEEIAERKREELKTICEILNSDVYDNTQHYDELAITSFYLDKDLEEVKSHIHKRKNRVLTFLKDILEKKAQSLIEETENTVRVKKQTIDEELKRITDHIAGQKKTCDMAEALVENGSNEEIMLSHKLVQQSQLENSEKEYGRKEIDDKLPQYSDGELDSKFFDEIKAINLKGMFLNLTILNQARVVPIKLLLIYGSTRPLQRASDLYCFRYKAKKNIQGKKDKNIRRRKPRYPSRSHRGYRNGENGILRWLCANR
jgi:hypothetical protein